MDELLEVELDVEEEEVDSCDVLLDGVLEEG